MTEQIVPERDLVKLFAEFQLPKAIQEMLKIGVSPLGSRNITTLFYFAAHVDLSNHDYNTIMAIRPERQENETYEYYKQRQKLQRFLGKYKPYFYNYYDEYDLNAKAKKIAARKAKRQLLNQI
jgi:hypothetical protein